MKYVLGIIAAFIVIFFSNTMPALAQTTDCQQGYGNGQSCPPQHKILVDVLVQDPNTGQYEQSLDANDAYSPDDPVNFRVDLTNTDTTAKTFPLQTVFPEGFTYAGGPGSYASGTRTVTLSVESLLPQQSRNFYYTARMENAGTNRQAVDCNKYFKAQVTIESATNEDTVQFCVDNRTAAAGGQTSGTGTTKGGQPIYPSQPSNATPKTGPEMLALVALLPAAASGYILRRKTRNV